MGQSIIRVGETRQVIPFFNRDRALSKPVPRRTTVCIEINIGSLFAGISGRESFAVYRCKNIEDILPGQGKATPAGNHIYISEPEKRDGTAQICVVGREAGSTGSVTGLREKHDRCLMGRNLQNTSLSSASRWLLYIFERSRRAMPGNRIYIHHPSTSGNDEQGLSNLIPFPVQRSVELLSTQ